MSMKIIAWLAATVGVVVLCVVGVAIGVLVARQGSQQAQEEREQVTVVVTATAPVADTPSEPDGQSSVGVAQLDSLDATVSPTATIPAPTSSEAGAEPLVSTDSPAASTQVPVPFDTVAPTGAPPATPVPTATLAPDGGRVVNGGFMRETPNGNTIAQVCPNDSVTFLNTQGEWYTVRVEQIGADCVPDRVQVGNIGWVHQSLLTAPIAAVATTTPLPPTATPLPQPVLLSGTGQRVTDLIVPPAAINRVEAQHNGQRNFQVTAYDATGERTLLVNEIGGYSGGVLLVASSEVFFEVNADGNWSLSVQPLGVSSVPLDSLSGTGDWTTDLFTPSRTGVVPYRFTHRGDSNFAVVLWCANGRDLVQNEIGPVTNEAVANFRGEPCFWEITANGAWTLEPR